MRVKGFQLVALCLLGVLAGCASETCLSTTKYMYPVCNGSFAKSSMPCLGLCVYPSDEYVHPRLAVLSADENDNLRCQEIVAGRVMGKVSP